MLKYLGSKRWVLDMVVEKIDLYSYFNIDKPEKARGILTVYAIDNNIETGLKRERSAMLILPGGGYWFVSYREGESIALAYLSHGIQAFVLDYSVAPEFIYPIQLREAAMAMIFIRENAKKYHVNPEYVASVGFSAGGHLCGALGTMFNSKVLEDLSNRDFVRPTAVILSYPVTIYGKDERFYHMDSFKNLTNDNEEMSFELSLDRWITKYSSPAFIWHTYNDPCVPVYGTLVIAQKYLEHEVPCELHVFAEGAHGLSVATEEVNSVNRAVAKWIDLSVAWLKGRGFTIYS